MSFLHNPPPIKYGIDPAPVPLNGDAIVDNIQELLKRKRELEKNKAKFRLSESDCNLLLTNANEYYFKDKQVVVHEGQELPSVYRVKSGNLNILKKGRVVSTISQGWFLGETIFLNGKPCIYDASLVANGPVTMCELNLEFVKKLFEVDNNLALKFYRTLASKLSSVCYALMGHVLGSSCGVAKASLLLPNSLTIPPIVPRDHSSSSSSFPSSPSSSSSSSSSQLDYPTTSPTRSRSTSYVPITSIAPPAQSMMVNAAKLSHCPNLPDSFLLEAVNRRRRISKSKSMSSLRIAFKVYNLESNSKGLLACKLKRNQVNLISETFGFKHKTTIEYSKIKNIVRTTENSITIIYNAFQATQEDAEEFLGLSLQLVDATTREIRKTSSGSPISSPVLTISDRPASFSGDQLFISESDTSSNSSDSKRLSPSSSDGSIATSSSTSSNSLKSEAEIEDDDLRAILLPLSTKEEFHKGDFLFKEGDLYQRTFTLISGTFVVVAGGRDMKTIGSGHVLGMPSLLHLRPSPVSVRVESETAIILILPAYKVNEIGYANLHLASRLYKKAATTLQSQIEEMMTNQDQMLQIDVGSFDDSDLASSSSSSSSSPPTTPKDSVPPSPRANVVAAQHP